WSAGAFRRANFGSRSAVAAVGAAPSWGLPNHVVVRHATRYGYSGDTGGAPGGVAGPRAATLDPARGLARARAATLMMLALPGSAYLYQGEELGLPEVTDLPAAVRQDPLFRRSHGQVLGRDGCRVPLPWSGDKPPFGFSTGTPWLPQPEQWASLTVAAQAADPGSTLAMYRRALRCRRRLRLGRGPLSWRPAPDPATLVFERPGLVCAGNCGDRPVRIDGVPARPELSSGPVPGAGVVPADAAAWWVVCAGGRAAPAGRREPPSEPLGEPVVGLVPADLVGELARRGVGVDQQQLHADHLGEVGQLLGAHRGGEHGVVRPTRDQPRLHRGPEVGAGPPDRPRHRQPGQRLVRWHHVDLVRDQPE